MSDKYRLIVVAPYYIANEKAAQNMFTKAKSATSLAIDDLSGLSHKDLNAAVLGAKADLALIIIDAAIGLEKRDLWAKTLSCLGQIPEVILAIDNMHQNDWSNNRFNDLKEAFIDHAPNFDCGLLNVVPVDVSVGENIEQSSLEMPWHNGPPLLDLLSIKQGKNQKTVKQESGITSDQFAVHLSWMAHEAMLPGRNYILKSPGGQAEAQITDLKHRIDPETLEHQAAKSLFPGDVGYCNISLDNAIGFTSFAENRNAGQFFLHNKPSGDLVAIGLIKHELRRATNIKWHTLDVDKKARAEKKNQTPCVLWFTGLSGSGKSTVANLVDKKLHAMGKHTYALDGDNVRHGLCRDLGFTDADRVENLRRISETAKLFADAGLIVLASFISPFRSERQATRDLFEDGEFLEVFVNAPLKVCEARDPKGLYKMARAGTLKNFTGIDSPYEVPERAEIDLPASNTSPEQLADIVINEMQLRGLLKIDDNQASGS